MISRGNAWPNWKRGVVTYNCIAKNLQKFSKITVSLKAVTCVKASYGRVQIMILWKG